MVKVNIYADKERNDGPVRVREMSPQLALDELVTNLCAGGFVEGHAFIRVPGNSKADTVRITITTHLLGPVSTPYLVVFEGPLEEGMASLGLIATWFVKATRSASDEVLHQSFS